MQYLPWEMLQRWIFHAASVVVLAHRTLQQTYNYSLRNCSFIAHPFLSLGWKFPSSSYTTSLLLCTAFAAERKRYLRPANDQIANNAAHRVTLSVKNHECYSLCRVTTNFDRSIPWQRAVLQRPTEMSRCCELQ